MAQLQDSVKRRSRRRGNVEFYDALLSEWRAIVAYLYSNDFVCTLRLEERGQVSVQFIPLCSRFTAEE